MQALPTLGGNYGEALGINNTGVIVGNSAPVSNVGYRPFRYVVGGTIQDLGTFGGMNGSAYAINDAGQIVGSAFTAGDAAEHAALWTITGDKVDLDAWLDSVNPALGAKWRLTQALDINNFGQIVGFGRFDTDNNGSPDTDRAFLLDATAVVPEPASMLLLLLPAVGIACARKR
jgi:probable HAF family extracellular repeat protein